MGSLVEQGLNLLFGSREKNKKQKKQIPTQYRERLTKETVVVSNEFSVVGAGQVQGA